MAEEQTVENMTKNMEKRSRHKFKKTKKKGASAKGVEEAKNVGKIQEIEEGTQIPENEGVFEERGSDHKRHGKDKKNIRGTKDAESSMNPGAYNEDGDAKSNVEAKNKKKKKREKNKDTDVIENERAKDGKDVRIQVENCQVNDVEMAKKGKKRKREKTRDGNDSMESGMLDDKSSRNERTEIVSEHKHDVDKKARGRKKRGSKECDEGLVSSLHQEKFPEICGGNIESTKDEGRKLEKRKGHKKKKICEDDSSGAQQEFVDNGSNQLMHSTELPSSEVESANKRKRKKIKIEDNDSPDINDDAVEHAKEEKKKKKKNTAQLVPNDTDRIEDVELSAKKGKKKKSVREENYSDNGLKSATKGTKKSKKLVEEGSDDQTPLKNNKKVRFSGEDEIFTLPIDLDAEKENDGEDTLVRGKRFTREEDAIIKDAVERYIEEHDLGEEGLHMVLNSSKYPRSKLKGCWREIGSAIPYRPYESVYHRAQVLFRQPGRRKWTQEEYEKILKYQEEHGNEWKPLAEELGTHRWYVKDTYRRIKLANLNKGNWSQDEYQKLFDLVNTDLQMKALEEKKSKHGMLRDNIAWTAISDTLSTRNQATCCLKWYNQLTSPMVSEGLWADVDDYRLLDALYSFDSTCMEDVDWDNLLDNRTGDICRKRWNQMVLHIGQHGNKSFAEQVEILAQRYCPNLVEAREAWDSKPRVP